MAWELMAFPLAEPHEDSFELELLADAGIAAPPFASAAPTASDLREAMVASGCPDPFWPDAGGWFYVDETAAQSQIETEVEGVPMILGAVGAVSVVLGPDGVVLSNWAGNWNDAVGMIAFRSPDPGAVFLVMRELAKKGAPVVVMDDVDMTVTLVTPDISLAELSAAYV